MAARLNSELFLIPDGNEYLVYAPLRKCLLRVTPQHVNLLVRLKNGQCQPGDSESDFYKSLTKAGIVDGPPELPPPTSVAQPFAPTRTTLLLTTRCNLACKYCYADAGKTGLVMKEKIGRAALDYLAANCKRTGKRNMTVGFHGGGEPTMAWEELVALTTYAKEVSAKYELKLGLGLATNGCFSESKARWIAAHFPHANISLDGPPRIQDAMRPRKDGGRSWPMIRRVLKVFDECKTLYSLQATVTHNTVRDMPGIVRYVARYTHPRALKFEPVSDSGRYSGRAEEKPLAMEFARWFNRAREEGERLGLAVTFSGLRLPGPPVSTFCGAFAEPFGVTPEGYVTACFEAFCGTATDTDLYLFGRWDESIGTFVIDNEKLERLRQRHVYNLEPCLRCFCKYSCAGDCATRNSRSFGNRDLFQIGARCEAIREITRQSLSEIPTRATRSPNQNQKRRNPV